MDRLSPRISLAIGAPIIAFMVIAGMALFDRQQFSHDVSQGLAAAGLALEGKRLIHALQAERGSSVGFLSARDNDFQIILEEARQSTDAVMARFIPLARQSPDIEDPVLQQLMGRLLADLDHLENHRIEVDHLGLEPIEALLLYNRLVEAMILIATHIPETLPDADIRKLITAYRPLLLLKEYSGLERALGSAWLGARAPDSLVFQHYVGAVAIQGNHRGQFMALAPPHLADLLVTIEAQPANQELLATRAAILNYGVAAKPEYLSAIRWFRITTERINALLELEITLTGEIMTKAGNARKRAQHEVIILLITILLLMGLSLGLSVAIARDLIHRYRMYQASMDRIAHMARHDPLTDLPNRRYFTELLEQRLQSATSTQIPCSLCLLDLKGFADLNRIWGESVADQVLTQVTDNIRAITPAETLLARIYGDQFALFIEHRLGSQDSVAFAEQILKALGSPLQVGQRRIDVTGKAGLITCPPYPEHAAELLALAAFALEHAKSDHRRNIRSYEPAMLANHTTLKQLDKDLEKGLKEGQFSLHYQPKIDLETGRIVSVEALLRWQHPDRGNVPPDMFIPRAEANGTIIEIGDYVLHEACRQARHWREHGHPTLTMAVNLSTVQIYQADLLERVEKALAQSGLPAAALELELTEGGLMEDMDTAASVLQRLVGLGISLSVDDFGTGYSSLAYLRRFPVDTLKLDKRFVQDLESGGDEEGETVAEAVLAMARSLSLICVAEGVETPAQAAWLKARGCQQAQGYLYGRPLPPEQCERLFSPETGASHSDEP
ncbi:putative bifunctional diguanylate cyclase/phosphodiesterase [Ectothiorhodospira lacustris]|uniref:putative bifunctional diguanylate cyclase/phosphodiesterase n=1 Tax=Ectothiorhodospira lacustris TaxID=2899127 RepID=UPI001EE8ECE6|nr:EAL domain-containing protein [Ectothiorhodospira lacustris]MCG5500007.1 EAL domain-containing protein [Ectothiorhodospira lacustris]MCG5510051.1 EAL domain-containing protein [Ectothiorhodospira lacustris]MCG5521797.1 EAL domain-containing protein [Ectothiorhodospira lacustris]